MEAATLSTRPLPVLSQAMVRSGPFELTLVHPNGEPLPEVEENGQAYAVAVSRRGAVCLVLCCRLPAAAHVFDPTPACSMV